MTNFNITLISAKFNNYSESHIVGKDIETLFGGLTFNEFQDKLIALVNKEEVHAVVKNTRGNEIFTMRHSPNCPEGVCCMWQNSTRLNRFIKSFAE